MIPLLLENDEKYVPISRVDLFIPETGALAPLDLRVGEDWRESVQYAGELEGLPDVVVDAGGDSCESSGNCYVHCVWVEQRAEWVGIVERRGYFDSVTHLDIVWDSESFQLSEKFGTHILSAFKLSPSHLSPGNALRTSPATLRSLQSGSEA